MLVALANVQNLLILQFSKILGNLTNKKIKNNLESDPFQVLKNSDLRMVVCVHFGAIFFSFFSRETAPTIQKCIK